MKRIWLVADDYGITKPVNRAIRDLIERGRLNATSVMPIAPSFDSEEASLLSKAAAAGGAAIGLHLTLTAPFRPLTPTYEPTLQSSFPSLKRTFAYALLGRLSRAAIRAEVRAQIVAFAAAFGRSPDFVDGHQHVHLLPQVADALLAEMRETTPQAWVRQCGHAPGTSGLDRKARILALLSRGFRRRAAQHGISTNPAFAGTYDFGADAQYNVLFPKFLDSMPDGGLIMCHPGIVDGTLIALDSLTTLRQREYDYFRSDAFDAALAAYKVALR